MIAAEGEVCIAVAGDIVTVGEEGGDLDRILRVEGNGWCCNVDWSHSQCSFVGWEVEVYRTVVAVRSHRRTVCEDRG